MLRRVRNYSRNNERAEQIVDQRQQQQASHQSDPVLSWRVLAGGGPVNSNIQQLPWRNEIKGDSMHILEHLFLVGEFPERAHLLSGLTLEQVRFCPEGASHSIYDELWHAAGYQRYVLDRGDAAGDLYPTAVPEHEHQWHDLVHAFLDGARAATAMGQTPERLALEVEPGVTMADELNSVAVHNAYHLGKIVALRQRIGAWPPKAASDGS